MAAVPDRYSLSIESRERHACALSAPRHYRAAWIVIPSAFALILSLAAQLSAQTQTEDLPPPAESARPARGEPTEDLPPPPNKAKGFSIFGEGGTSDGISGNDVSGAEVTRIVIEGNKAVDTQKALRFIRTREGKPLDPLQVMEDVRALTKSRMFVNVNPMYRKDPSGGLIVIFRVVERPIIEYVKYVGAQKKFMFFNPEKTLNKETGLKKGDARDPYMIEEGRRKLEEYYHSKGYNKVRVTIFEGDKPEDRGVVYLIHEGPKERIWDVEFVGNTIVSGDRLKAVIQSKPLFYFFKNTADRSKIDADINLLVDYYRNLGYFKAEVGRELEFTEDGWLKLTFVVNEGPRYIIRDITFEGNTKYSPEQLAEKVKLKSGDYFDRAKVEFSKMGLEDLYGVKGHVFAEARPEPVFDDQPGTLDLVFHVKEGDVYKAGTIDVKITGDDPHTRLDTVYNRLSIFPGRIINKQEIRNSERRLGACGLFAVDPTRQIRPEISLNPNNIDPDDPILAGRDKDRGKKPSPNGGNVRGQSPDPPRQASRYSKTKATTAPSPWRPSSRGASNTANEDVEEDVYADRANQNSRKRSPASASSTSQPRRYAPPDAVTYRGQDPGSYSNPFGGSRTTDLSSSSAEDAAYPADRGTRKARTTAGNRTSPNSPSSTRVAQRDAPAGGTEFPKNGELPETTSEEELESDQEGEAQPSGLPPGGRVLSNDGAIGSSGGLGLPGNSVGNGFNSPEELIHGDLRDPTLIEEPPRTLVPQVTLQETQTGRITLGAGYNSNAGLVGQFVVEERNFDITRVPGSWEDVRLAQLFRGAGQYFRLESMPGTQLQRHSITFREPYLMSTNFSFGVNAFYYNRIFKNWNEQRMGGMVTLGYQLTPDLSVNLGLGAEEITIYKPFVPTPPQLQRVLGDNEAYKTSLELIYDVRDSQFLPTQGHRVGMSVEHVFGSFDYTRGSVEAQKHFLLWQRADGSGRHVLSFNTQFSVASSDTPLYDNYYAGGYQTIRGFNFRGANPHVNGVSVGGRFMMLKSVQYMFPLTASDMLRGVVFCDTGTVEDDVRLDASNYRVAPGFGLRFSVPMMGPAPIAVDLAFPVASAPGDDIQNFSVFVGMNW